MKKIDILENLETNEEFKENKINHRFYWAYEKAKRVGLERLDFEELGFEKDYKEIIENLERFEIKEFTISDQSTALMDELQAFKNKGYSIVDLIEQETGRIDWNFETQEDEKEIKPALVLRKIEK